MGILSKKLCMVGDFGVGKTSLIRRFVERQFSDRYLSTVGVKISRKTMTIADSERGTQDLKLLIWDIEGQTKFKAIAPSYLQGASGILAVADLTRQETVEHLADHIRNFLAINQHGFIAVALNKADLIDREELAQIRNLLEQPSEQVIGVYQTSAKTGESVDTIFEHLTKRIWTKGN
ncbi:MAG: GTP-binding protein [Spirulinaceae cyanobacterium RM2_2_10]|nr:GTP-binding protein [Spirulinaceae cyanobacterium SM2_1_0]NJO19116.1 GTP-binding protein [Spirulinaceae cyanobacterium RM2_2_10]